MMKAMKNMILGLLLTGAMMTTAAAQKDPGNPCGHKNGMMFHIDDPMSRNSVTFKSTAPLEDIVGTSNEITGYIQFNPSHPENGGHGEFTVPVASLNTGIPLRDEHLRSADWLNAGAYPDIKLTVKNIKNIKEVKSSGDAQTYDITFMGNLSFNGKTRYTEVKGRMTYLQESEATKQRMPGDLVAVRAELNIPLAEFDVIGPEGMGIIGSKVGETIDVEISLMASTRASSLAAEAGNPCGDKAMNPCNPCGGKSMDAHNPCGMKKSDSR